MNKLLKKYLLVTYSQTFFPIFLTLFIITSIMYLVRVSALTSVMEINFAELLTLYSFYIPSILFYTLPISIFISIAISLSKLSTEYELIVITSFGLKPTKILKLLFPTLLFSTIFLLINSLVLIPKANHLYDNFKAKKEQEAKFNIKASEYGQAFGDWLIYVNEKKDGLYKDVVLFQQNQTADTVVISNSATLKNEESALGLHLKDGNAVKIDDVVTQIDFKKMTINNKIKPSENINNLSDLLLYWSDIDKSDFKRYKFNFSILMSFFPILSLLFFISLGFYNPRYEKNKTSIYAILLAIIFVIASQKLSKKYGFEVLYIIPTFWIIFSYLTYRVKIKSHY
ncbi:MAG: LptF/LptG family permease [Campylobacterota bacterium]|nr:LptF/LptG family permease [Campylobacterota bacterium]